MREEVFPAEESYDAYRAEVGPEDHTVPPVIEELQVKARERGLWNLFLPSESGLTLLEYAPIAELSGWSNELAPEAMNCQAPDTGNMELLHLIGTEEQQVQLLQGATEWQLYFFRGNAWSNAQSSAGTTVVPSARFVELAARHRASSGSLSDR